MFELSKTFSVTDIAIDRNEEDKDFAIAEIWALSTGGNSHKNPFSKEILERDAYTFKGKFIIGKYDRWTQDTEGHEIQEDIYGYVSVLDEPQFKTKIVDGIEKEFVVVKAYISKIYAKEIVDMFKIDNYRSVSCEFSCALEYPEDEYGRPIIDGVAVEADNPVLGYSISGITILSKKLKPSVKGADIVMKRFSEDSDKLKNTSKEETMEEMNKFSEEPTKEEDIVMEQVGEEDVDAVKGNTEIDSVEGEEKKMAEETPKSEEEPKTEKGEKAEEEKEMACGEGKKEMGCGGEDEKKMSEDETPVEKTFAEQVIECVEDNYKEFVEKLFADAKECAEQIVGLKKYMDERIKFDTDKRFSEIMVEPKLRLGEKAYNVLFEEGKNLSLNELDAFEVKVKAFCEDAPKKQEENDEMLKFSCGNTETQVNTDLSVEQLIEKYR